MDISEEIEKVEIDLRKCTSQLAIKRELVALLRQETLEGRGTDYVTFFQIEGEYDVVKSRLLDIQKSWKDEWHGFRIVSPFLSISTLKVL